METIEQQALRMACSTFLSDYEGTPDLATLDQMLITATIWEPFEDYPLEQIQDWIVTQTQVNERELIDAYHAGKKYMLQLHD